MLSLMDLVADADSESLLWQSSSGECYRASDIKDLVSKFDFLKYKNRTVSLGDMKPTELLIAMMALDGIANRIVFLPENISPEHLNEIQSSFNVDFDWNGDFSNSHTQLNLEKVSTEWILPTSGTTGLPKFAKHTLESLTRTARGGKKNSDYVWGCLYSFKRFAGIQVFLQALVSKSRLLVNDGSGLPGYVRFMADSGCNSLSGTPTIWRKMLMMPEFEEIDLRQITLGGEIADQAILSALRNKFPAARIVHIYASTEIGVGFSVKDGLAGFPRTYLTKNPYGFGMRVDGDGHLLIRKPDSADWLDTEDLVRIDGERIYFLGRSNGSINVGGNKVFPEEVESTIRRIDYVVDARVYGIKNSIMGNLVSADVQLSGSAIIGSETKKNILEYCRSNLDSYKVPMQIKFVDSFEMSSSGKISRQS